MQCFPDVRDAAGFFIVFKIYILRFLLLSEELTEFHLRNITIVSNGSQCTHLSHQPGLSQFEGRDYHSAISLYSEVPYAYRSSRVILYHSLHLCILSPHHSP